MNEHSHHDHTDHSDHSQISRLLTGLAIGGVVLGAGVILAPHILPALGIGSTEMAGESMVMLHNSSGLAGAINNVLSAVPLIGGKLATGGLFNAAVTGVVGIGGVLLGNFVAEREDGSKAIKWGNLIKYAALATSAFIALPTVLTSLSCGLIYLATLSSNASLAPNVIGFVRNTLGAVGMSGAMMGMSGIPAAIPHFLTCGMTMLPAALSMTVLKDDAPHAKGHASGENIAVEVQTNGVVEAGKPCHLHIRLKDEKGHYLTADELSVVHTKKLHLLLVDQSLGDYHHVHPQPTNQPDVFEVEFTPRTSNRYTAWADFTPARDGQNRVVATQLPSACRRNVPASVQVNNDAQAEGISAQWESEGPLRQGAGTMAHVSLRDAAGKPITDLEPVMGAYAHLVGFSADGKSLIHSHPLGVEPATESDRGGPRLDFHVMPESSGAAQFYLQVKREGKEVMLPFGQRILPPEKTSHREMVRPPVASHHHATAGHAI